MSGFLSLFLLCFFMAPLFTSMATYVAAPALIYVGLTLLLRFREVDRSKTILYLFGIVLVLYVGISFNVGNAVLYGLLIYMLIKKFILKENVAGNLWIIPIFAVIHILLNLV